MSATPVFTVTYWGITGTLSTPLLPTEVTTKLVNAISRLVENNSLAGLHTGLTLEEDVRRLVQTELPFHLRSTYGGNTTCIEVQTPDALLIVDCGSGFRELGVALDARWRAQTTASRQAHILITHAHMDHTFATPYFIPYYNARNHFTLWGSQSVIESLKLVLDPTSRMSQVYFPPTFEQMKAIREFREISAGTAFQIGQTRLTTYALNHPGGCLAYRMEHAGKVIVIATDHEQKEIPDPQLAAFARNADLFYTEGQYTQAEYDGKVGPAGDPPASRHGWGHSSVEACVATALAAGVRQLHIGHREPRHSDSELAAVEQHIVDMVCEELHRLGRPADSCRALIPFEGMTVHI